MLLAETDAAQEPCAVFHHGDFLLERQARLARTVFANWFGTTRAPAPQVSWAGARRDRHDHVAVDTGKGVLFIRTTTVCIGREPVAAGVSHGVCSEM